jgi:sulfatase modifying factor 1
MIRILTLALLTAALYCMPAHAVTFDWATVGNPGNADDNTGFGGVDYVYRISKYEVTNAQYTEFLNAVAATDTYGLFPRPEDTPNRSGIIRSGIPGSYTYSLLPDSVDYMYGNKPANYVSFLSAMRFVNWLHNGQGSGGTESGAYTIGTGTDEVRSASAKFWIPSEDEWYKAAYYDPDASNGIGAYNDYATSSDALPNNNPPSADTGNSANFPILVMGSRVFATGDGNYPLTDVGAYSLSKSPYGTFDQTGNVAEWTEAIYSPSIANRVVRGGSWWQVAPGSVSYRFDIDLGGAAVKGDIGFRVATVRRAGDFNGDDLVDGADFLFWQRHPGVGDLAEWRTHFGRSVGGHAVPEPRALHLTLTAVALAAFCLRRAVNCTANSDAVFLQ